LIDALPVSMGYFDAETRLRFANRAFFEGIARLAPAAIGMKMSEIFGPLFTHEMGVHLEGALRGEPQRFDQNFPHPNGNTYAVETQYIPKFRDGEVIGVYGVVQNMTWQRQRAEAERSIAERMQKAQKLESLGALAGGVAHDFNNLFVGILGSAEIARGKLGPGSTLREDLDRIIECTDQAARLCRQMLSYAGKSVPNKERINLSALLAETEPLIHSAVRGHLTLECADEAQLPLVEADGGQLQQVLVNLINNAVEAAGDSTATVRVATYLREFGPSELNEAANPVSAGGYVVLEVRDAGSGMSESVRKRMFDPFFTTRFEGRGLGLASVLGIIRALSGTLLVDSQEGTGTRVRVLLKPVEAAPGVANVSQSPQHVLVVDDDRIVRSACAGMLKVLGYAVSTAASGVEALDALDNAEPIDVVLLDLTMPDMSGSQVARRIWSTHPRLPIVVSSGYTEVDTRELSALGPMCFLGKPFRHAQLEDAIERAVSVGLPTA
jgi:signal transduction histidine kinase/ActR/RegA family two-component response regulator